MARTILTAVTAGSYGGSILDIAAGAVDNGQGNNFQNTGLEKLIVINSSGASVTVTIGVPANARSLQGLITAKAHTIANGKTAVLGPFDPSIFNQQGGFVNVDWSTGTGVTCAVVNHIPTPTN